MARLLVCVRYSTFFLLITVIFGRLFMLVMCSPIIYIHTPITVIKDVEQMNNLLSKFSGGG